MQLDELREPVDDRLLEDEQQQEPLDDQWAEQQEQRLDDLRELVIHVMELLGLPMTDLQAGRPSGR